MSHKAWILIAVMSVVLALTIAMWVRHRKGKTNWDMGDAAYAFIVADRQHSHLLAVRCQHPGQPARDDRDVGEQHDAKWP